MSEIHHKALNAVYLPFRMLCLLICALLLLCLFHGNSRAATPEDAARPASTSAPTPATVEETAQKAPLPSAAPKDASPRTEATPDAAPAAIVEGTPSTTSSDASGDASPQTNGGVSTPPSGTPPAEPSAAAPPDTAASTEPDAAPETAPTPDQDALRAARDTVNACWKAGEALYLHGLNFENCGQALEAPLTAWLETRPRLIAGKEQGARLLMRTSSQPPNFTRVPTPLYLLVENADVLPKPLRAPLREARKVLGGTPLEGMEDGPLLLRLHPRKSTTAPLLRWYLSDGAAEGHTLILGSREDMDVLLRRVAAWHLMLWERKKDAPRALLARPANPGLLKTLLPGLRGKAAALFVGPGDGLWFRYPTPRGAQWYDVKAERALPALGSPDVTLQLPEAQVRALEAAFDGDYAVQTAQELQRTTPKRRVSPEKTLEFVHRVTRHINALPDVPGSMDWGLAARRSVLELLWQAYGTPKENAVAHALLSDDDTPLEARLEKARGILR